MFQRDGTAGVSDELPPTLRHAGLHGNPRTDSGRQDRLAVGLVLLVEPLQAGERDNACSDAVLLQGRPCLNGKLDFRAGCNQDDVRLPVRGFGQHVGALRHSLGRAEGVTGRCAVSAFPGGDVLAGEDDSGGVGGVLKDGAPGDGDLICVTGADDVESRDGTQGSQLLNRLVRGAVFAEADGVVGPDVDGRDSHQGAEPDGGPLVVAEDQECSREGAGAAVHDDAVDDGCRSVLTDSEVQHAPVRVPGPGIGLLAYRDERRGALDRGVVRFGEVGGTAPELGQHGTDGAEHLA